MKKLLFLSVILIVLASTQAVFAQSGMRQNPNLFEFKGYVVDAATIQGGEISVALWGINPIDTDDAKFKLKAMSALEDMTANQILECDKKGQTGSRIVAQCLNENGVDLALYVLQKGFASVDRAVVEGTPFENTYINAQKGAVASEEGIWGNPSSEHYKKYEGTPMLVVLSLVILIFAAGIFVVLTLMLLRGLKKSIAAQDRNAELIIRERELRDREKKIVASMLNAELRGNKEKIEAHISIYEDMLRNLRDPSTTQHYKETGDMVQMQPALDRSIFDGNTDKMDLLGRELSQEIIHFYARIKTHPDFKNLEPDMDLEKASRIVEEAVDNAKKLDGILTGILDVFANRNY